MMGRGLALLMAGWLACGCGRQAEAPRTAPEGEADYRLEVRNRNFYSVNVYIYRDGFRDRLGDVPAKQNRNFTFDWPLTEVSLLIDFQSGGGCIRTESLPLVEGDDLLLIVGAEDHRRARRELCSG
jgi:hypothetical protein